MGEEKKSLPQSPTKHPPLHPKYHNYRGTVGKPETGRLYRDKYAVPTRTASNYYYTASALRLLVLLERRAKEEQLTFQ
jgi:hypothetical protein